jgi:DNA-binding transcriptional LysR family regulator
MDLAALRIFLAVAEERSFSRAAAKVHRTQPAVSQAVRRLEDDLGETLFDRSSKSGTLTDAGRTLQNYGQRLVRLAEETESAMRELRDLRRGRVLIGANEAAVSACQTCQSTSAASPPGRLLSRSSREAWISER